jgi:hypothetical protein
VDGTCTGKIKTAYKILRRKEESSIQSAEMTFLPAVKGCTQLEHISNEKIREDLGVKPVLPQIIQYKES